MSPAHAGCHEVADVPLGYGLRHFLLFQTSSEVLFPLWHEEDARLWLLKAGVWREVEILVGQFANPAEEIRQVAPNPLEVPANVSRP